MRPNPLLLTGLAVLALVTTGCGGSSNSSVTSTEHGATATLPATSTLPATPSPPTTTTLPLKSSLPATSTLPVTSTLPLGAVDPNAPEVVEPGDIPDNQVFVTFSSPDGTFSVDVPEGWARTERDNVVTFTDKYNSVTIQSMPASSTPTIDSVTAQNLTDVSLDPTFALVDVTTVTRQAGDGVRAVYEIGSAPNEVTGKKALLEVERYVFFHNGTLVVLTLSGAKGADNVDPWKTVSDSLTWI